MSSHKSEHLDLHLWEPGDDFLRTEFNENFAAVDAHAGACSYVIGSYAGDGGTQTIELGFRPRFLIVACMNYDQLATTSGGLNLLGRFAILGENRTFILNHLELLSNGFQIKHQEGVYCPRLNEAGYKYAYIAFQ